MIYTHVIGFSMGVMKIQIVKNEEISSIFCKDIRLPAFSLDPKACCLQELRGCEVE